MYVEKCLYRNLSSRYMVVRLQEEWFIYAVDSNVLLSIVHCLIYINIYII